MTCNGRFSRALLVASTFAILLSSEIVHAQTPPPSQAPGAAEPPATDTQSPPKSPGAPAKPAGEGIPALVVDTEQMQGILGKQVRSSTGEDMGRIVDVIVDRSARVRAAVIDFGGFLGVGSRQIAVAWTAIRRNNDNPGTPGTLSVDFTRDQLRVAPTYKAGEQIVLIGQVATPNDAAPAAADKGPQERAPQPAK